MSGGQRFRAEDRLRRASEFSRVFDQRQRAGDETMLVFAATNELGRTRVGLSVSRKNGNAVMRNRIKRLLREAFRTQRPQLPAGLDLVLIPRPGSGATLAEYQRSLVRLTAKLDRRLNQQRPS